MDDKQLDALLKESFKKEETVPYHVVNGARKKVLIEQERRERLGEVCLFITMVVISMVLTGLSYHLIEVVTGNRTWAIIIAGGGFVGLEMVVIGSLIGNLYYKEVKNK